MGIDFVTLFSLLAQRLSPLNRRFFKQHPRYLASLGGITLVSVGTIFTFSNNVTIKDILNHNNINVNLVVINNPNTDLPKGAGNAESLANRNCFIGALKNKRESDPEEIIDYFGKCGPMIGR